MWHENKVYEGNPAKGRPKFFITAAFMYPNAPAHLGHARVYMIADILARFMRMRGYNTLYPMGFHYTGTPILAMAESIASNDKELINELRELYNINDNIIPLLGDPLTLARYFHEVSKKAMNLYGLGIDWRREFTTVDPEFKSFIRWQFEKLREKGLVEQGSHPVGWCPNHQMPVGMHDTKDDVEPEIDEITVIKFIGDGVYYPTATLRPETVLGVTNLWVNPAAEYCVCNVVHGGRSEKWVISCEAAHKLSFQLKIDVESRFHGYELIGKYVTNPLTGRKIKVLEASFVDPKFGTGVVMSVPAHAPYDYVALIDYLRRVGGYEEELKPIPLITTPGYSDIPARDVVNKLGVVSQEDRELLDKATKEVYLSEFSNGVMRSDLHTLIVSEVVGNAREFISRNVNGVPVGEARERIKNYLLHNGYAASIYEIMNRPVYCRCGAEVVVKVFENQWFINYGNPEWKSLAREALSSMRLIPEESRKQYEATIEWLQRKACARSRGLGTELPWERGWIIESLSDSTIYMAFYTVIHKIRGYGISADKLTKEFWDYVLLGEGDAGKLGEQLGIPVEYLFDIRNEFTYWYPLDARCSGKDLIPNHLTFFIFNHVAIFPRQLWPKMIIANGWVLREGEKMSKSKRNVLTLEKALEKYSPDGLRATLALSAEVEQDLDFRESNAVALIEYLRSVESLIYQLAKSAKNASNEGICDRWLRSRLQRHIKQVTEDLTNVRLRAAAVRVIYLMYQDLMEYLSMSSNNISKAVDEYIEAWVKMLSPYIPHLAEEIWHNIGKSSLIVSESWPSYDEGRIDNEAELAVEYVKNLVNDAKEVMKLIKGGKKLVVYVSSKKNYEELIDVINHIESGGTLSNIIKEFTQTRALRIKADVAKKVRKLYELALSLRPDVRELIKSSGGIDEKEVINAFNNYIKNSVGIEEILVYDANDPKAPDYGGKKYASLPFKPGIYILN